jgi:hypothetical protein
MGRVIPWPLQQPSCPVVDTSWNQYCYGYVITCPLHLDRRPSAEGIAHSLAPHLKVAQPKNARLLLTPGAYRSYGYHSTSSSFVELSYLEGEKDSHYRHVQSWIFVSGVARASLIIVLIWTRN